MQDQDTELLYPYPYPTSPHIRPRKVFPIGPTFNCSFPRSDNPSPHYQQAFFPSTYHLPTKEWWVASLIHTVFTPQIPSSPAACFLILPPQSDPSVKSPLKDKLQSKWGFRSPQPPSVAKYFRIYK